MKRFSKKGHRTPHSTKSHHSGRNLSVSSLPTITEEGKKKRVPSMSSKSKANRSDKLAVKDSKLGRRRSNIEEEKGLVAEVGIADEEDSMDSSENQSSDSSEVGPTMIERMPSRFFEQGRIVEAADIDEFDEVSTPAFREESQPEDESQA